MDEWPAKVLCKICDKRNNEEKMRNSGQPFQSKTIIHPVSRCKPVCKYQASWLENLRHLSGIERIITPWSFPRETYGIASGNSAPQVKGILKNFEIYSRQGPNWHWNLGIWSLSLSLITVPAEGLWIHRWSLIYPVRKGSPHWFIAGKASVITADKVK